MDYWPQPTPPPDLFLNFESLGNNCELGIVQRHHGLDPPGLFRNVGFLSADQIVNTIENGLDGMFDDGRYRLTLPPNWPDWRLDCEIYGFGFHTSVPASLEHGSAEWVDREHKTIATFRFLKQKFIDDLQSGEKIFVFRFIQDVAPETIFRLHRAIRTYGDGWLLYVKPNPAEPFGWVERAEDGLLVGSLPRLSNEDPPQIDFANWEIIAQASLAIVEAARR
jgi:hypothetical protein